MDFAEWFFDRPWKLMGAVVDSDIDDFHLPTSLSQSFTVQLITFRVEETLELGTAVSDTEVSVEEGTTLGITIRDPFGENMVDLGSSGTSVFVIRIF